ncbi:MAG: hypothetical protein A2Z18_02575 [Armatimonadetes bacterium RBG_16_58_9]|nr:MAG: hypothetical protein A2Z18_02575 [Armatimonadetes bacterium RBG_16_58_9]
MAQGGVLGNGTKVGFSAASPVSWTRVGQLLDDTFPSLETQKVDSTIHGTSKFMRNMPGMIAVGDLTLIVLGDLDEGTDAAMKTIYDYLQSQTTLWWRIEVPVDRAQTEFTAFEFQGFVASFNYLSPITDRQTAEINIGYDSASFVRYNAGATAIT